MNNYVQQIFWTIKTHLKFYSYNYFIILLKWLNKIQIYYIIKYYRMKPELLVKRIVYHGDLEKRIIQFCWKYADKQEVDTVENFLTGYGRMLK